MKLLKELKNISSTAETLSDKVKDYMMDSGTGVQEALESISDLLDQIPGLVDEAIGAIEEEAEAEEEDED